MNKNQLKVMIGIDEYGEQFEEKNFNDFIITSKQDS
jgi:hypothetical protein